MPKMLPGRFRGLAEFTQYCHEVVRRYGPTGTVRIRWSGPPPKRGRKEVGIGLLATHLHPCPDQLGWQIYQVGAQEFADCALRGGLIESHKHPYRR
ncbi:hypothetical protein [Deinococcus soli (ex Cha et al. 2016)]|uniref:hypothetical protein n=1 Tax=Deinococcus soli (ex Cha et al. 2016) TaxID=1309411 RepID=UPI00166A325D|nr:hypothetical protein [Deinococcus soli (ex Cha et al. 2016)]GGB71358.1 hypothetical protein GCM10008019_29430 [Deinococcus soli (ex Cha et al. 2016)]